MYIFDRLSPYSYQNNKEKYADDDEKKVFTMRECLWFCITSITPQVSIKLIQIINIFDFVLIKVHSLLFICRVVEKHPKVSNFTLSTENINVH